MSLTPFCIPLVWAECTFLPILYTIALCTPLLFLAHHFAPFRLILTSKVKSLGGSLGNLKN